MKKDAYYFPHYSNARADSKILKLRRVLGIEGYGIYFMLLEVLREQTNFKYPIRGLEDLAYEWHTSKEKLMSVIVDYDLFEIEDDVFYSSKLILYLQPYIEKTERARAAALKRWNNANADAKASINNANALPEHNKCNADAMQGKERRGEESKVKELNIPTLKEFQLYALSKKNNLCLESLKLKYESWKENEWKDGNNKKIKNWKSKLINTIPYLIVINDANKKRNTIEADRNYTPKW